MAEQHDIVLVLDSRKFENAINIAISLLDKLGTIAEGLNNKLKNVQNTLNNINLDTFTNKINEAKKASDSLGNNVTGIQKIQTGINNTAQAANNATKPLNAASQAVHNVGQSAKKSADLFDFLTRGFEIGIAHSVGAISVGANVIKSLTHEIIRNLSISLFNFSLKKVKDELDNTAQSVQQTGANINQSTGPIQTLSQTLNTATQSASGFATVFANVGKIINFQLLAISGGFILLGSLLDKIGDKLVSISVDLAKTSGTYSVSLAQLDAVVQANERSTGRLLGTNEEWKQSLVEISKISGKSIDDLSALAASFIGIDKSASISAKGIQQLVESAAILSPLFRNQIELLTNFRAALLGNFRAINSNIFVANNQADANQKYLLILQQQGKTQEEATKLAEKTSQTEKNRVVILEAAAARVDKLKNSTDLLNVANLKLQGTLQNLLATIGRGSEVILARFNNFLAKLLEGVLQLPEGLLKAIGGFTLISGAVTTVGGKILKLAGYVGVLTVAITALNAVMLRTIPILGTSLSAVLGSLAIRLGAPISQLTALPATFGGAIGTIVSAFTTRFLPVILSFVKYLTIIGTIITGLVLGFNRFSDAMGGLTNTFNALLSPISTVLLIFKELIGETELGERALAVYKIAVVLLAKAFAILAESALGWARAAIAVRRYFGDTEELRKKSIELEAQIKNVQKAQKELNDEFSQSITTLFASSKAIDENRKALQAFSEFLKTSRAQRQGLNLDEEQQKAFEKLQQSLKDQIELLKIRNIELTQGKGAAAQEKIRYAIEKGIKAINEASKEGTKLTKDQEDVLRFTLYDYELEAQKLATNNEILNEKLKLVKKISEEIEKTVENINEEIAKRQQALSIEQTVTQELLRRNTSVENAINNAEKEVLIRQAIFDLDNKIAKLREKITKGELVEGQLIKIDPEQALKAEEQIRTLEALKPTIRFTISLEKDQKEINTFIKNISNEIQSLLEKLSGEDLFNKQQIRVLEEYNKDLNKGVEYAERRREINEKTLDITREINKLERQLSLTSTNLTDEIRLNIEQRISELYKERGNLVKSFSNKKQIEDNLKIKEDLIKINSALEDQLQLIDIRNQLFREGVLVGQFSATEEKISALTSTLQDYLNERLKLERLDPDKIGLYADKIQIIDDSIKDLSESLKALQFVKTIESALNAITDAFEEVITDGVKGVLEGTQTIQQLFRNMVSNILLSLSKISAQSAIDKIKNSFSDLSTSLAKSDVFKKIASAFGVDLEKLSLGGIKSPQDLLQTATTSNTTATVSNTTVLTQTNTLLSQLIARLNVPAATGLPGLGQSTTPTTLPEIDFDGWFAQIREGTAQLELITNQEFGQYWQDFSGFIQFGFDDVSGIISESSSGFFSGFGDLLSQGFEGLSGLLGGFDFGSLFGGGGGGFGSIFSSILPLIGFSKGGLVSGSPSKKDDQIRPVASGEFIANSDAVKYYGTDLFNKLNNTSLPRDFLDTMQQNSAATALSQVKPTVVGSPVVSQSDDRPINITIIDKSPKLDPSSFKMTPKEVTQIFVDGVRKDRVIRKVIREDLSNGSPR